MAIEVMQVDSAGNGLTYDGVRVGSGFDAVVWRDARGRTYGALYDVADDEWGGWVELGDVGLRRNAAAIIANAPGDYWRDEDEVDLLVVDRFEGVEVNTFGALMRYETGDYMRPATRAERDESREAAERDGGAAHAGANEIDRMRKLASSVISGQSARGEVALLRKMLALIPASQQTSEAIAYACDALESARMAPAHLRRRPVKRAPICVVYARVSTDEQAESRLGLAAQRRDCEAWAARSGLSREAAERDGGGVFRVHGDVRCYVCE